MATQTTIPSNQVTVFFYPLSKMYKVQVNFAPTQGTFTITPAVDVLPLVTKYDLTFGTGDDG